jgi:hypothetical protein
MMQDVSSANEAHNAGGYKVQENMVAEPQSSPILEAPGEQPMH